MLLLAWGHLLIGGQSKCNGNMHHVAALFFSALG